MDEPRILALLLKRLKAGGDPRKQSAGVSRRQVLLGAGAATTALVTGAALFRALQIRRRGAALEVSLGGHAWLIDPAKFGASSRVHWRRTRDVHDIHLLDARLPGTNLDLSFTCSIKRTPAGWRNDMQFVSSERRHELDLAQWLSSGAPLELTPPPGGIHLGHRAALQCARARCMVNRDLTVRIVPSTGRDLALELPNVTIRATSATLSAVSGEAMSELGLNPDEHVRATKVSLAPATESLDLNSIAADPKGRNYSLSFKRLQAATLVTHESDGISEVLLEGAGHITRADSTANRQTTLRLEKIAHWMRIDQNSDEALVAAELSRKGFGVDAGAFVAHIRQHPDTPLIFKIREQRLESAKFQALLYELNTPVHGADTSRVSFEGLPIEVDLHSSHSPSAGNADRKIEKAVSGKAKAMDAISPPSWTESGLGYVILDSDAPYFLAPLDKGRLHIGRGGDLLDLSFEFRNYDLKVDLSGPTAYPSKGIDCKVPARRPRLIVTLPPQHVQEKAFEQQIDGVGSYQPALRPLESRSWAPDLSEIPVPPTRKLFDPVVRARVANRSRLVFEDCDATHDPKPIPLRVDDLTKWERFQLVVNSRARPKATVIEQLQDLKITLTTTRVEAFANIRASLTAPDADETAIEFPYRLVLSPNTEAKWVTPRGRPPKKGAVLWHARLAEVNRSSVRAVWARGIDLSFLTGTEPNDRVGPYSLNGSDRRQLVTLSSVYGLPALRRLNAKQYLDQDLVSSSGVQAPLPSVDQNNTSGTVVKPDGQYAFLQPGNDEGVWIPKPLDLSDLVLTPLGATCDLEWKGEPPAPISGGQKPVWGPAVAVERWRHQAVLGRDVHVQVDYKGFLMPLGHRAALVKLTERHFYRHPTMNTPTAYLIQRRFIVINKPLKAFPGLNQADGGRAFPASQIEILTQHTPDIVNPELQGAAGLANGRLFDVLDKGPGLVFWPRTKPLDPQNPGDGLILFEWRVNGDAAPVRSPLLFVDNAAVHDVARVQKAMDAYNAYKGQDALYRTAQHSGASRRYAPEIKAGEAHYDTATWIMTSIPGTNGSYAMDAAMEGQDQPPFYPAMERGFVTIQTIDRLLGKPQGLIEVRVDPCYLKGEFRPQDNPAELFLDVYTPGIYLNLGGQGDAAGGVAQPSVALGALSRKIGLVGGQSAKLSASRLKSLKVAGGSRADPPPNVIDKAAAGTFDPTEFFGSALSATILGVVKLSDVILSGGIATAPKLLETIQYRLGQSKVMADMQVAAIAVLKAIGDAVDTVSDNATKTLKSLGIKDVTWPQLYPDLDTNFRQLKTTLDNAALAVNGAQSNIELFAALTPVVGAIGQTKGLIQALAENPTPSLLQTEFDKFKQILELLQSLGQSGKTFGEVAWDNLVPEFLDACRDLPDPVRQLLFGYGQDVCDDLKTNPFAALHAIQETLFFDVFGRPLSDAFAMAQRLKSQFDAKVYLVESRVQQSLVEAIQNVPGLPDPVEAKKLAAAFGTLVSAAFLVTDLSTDPIGESARRFTALETQIQAVLVQEFNNPTLRDSIRQRVLGLLHELIDPQVADLSRFISERSSARQRSAATQIFDVASTVIQSLASTAEIGWINSAIASANTWCAGAQGQLSAAEDFAQTVASGLIADDDVLLGYIKNAEDSIAALQLPAGSPAEAILAVDRARAALNGAFNDLVTAMADLQQSRSQLMAATPTNNVCSQFAAFLPLVDQIVALRTRSVAEIARGVAFVVEVQNVVNPLGAMARLQVNTSQSPLRRAAWARLSKPSDLQPIKDAIAAITKALSAAMSGLTSIGRASQNGLGGNPSPAFQKIQTLISTLKSQAALKPYTGYVQELTDILPALQKAAISIQTALNTAAGDPVKVASVCGDIASYAIQYDRHIAAVVLKSVVAGGQVWSSLDAHVATATGALASSLETLHLLAADAAKTIVDSVNNNPILNILVRPDLLTTLSKSEALIRADAKDLHAVQSAVGSGSFAALTAMKKILDRWNPGPAALVAFVDVATGVIDSLVHGQLGAIFEFSGLQEALRDALADFVPSTIDLAYDWGTQVQNLDDLFRMTAGPSPDDLSLKVRVSVDLLHNTHSFQATGSLKPFVVNILGSSMDLLAIHFKGATFSSGTGQGASFDAPIDFVEVRDALDFIKALESWLDPGDSGLFIVPHLSPPSIEVGWKFDAGIIDLGDIQFINVALYVSADLPFDSVPAVIKFSLATKESPFLIAADPYGGGGYIGIKTCATSIVGVDTSLEFGAVVAVKFGPLEGSGRVTAGIYMAQDGLGTQLGGFVHAVGEGHIACFGVAINIEVGVVNANGTMTGHATYSMTFEVGFVDVTLEFTAHYTISGSGGGVPAPVKAEEESNKNKVAAQAAINRARMIQDDDCCSDDQRHRRAASVDNRVFKRLVPEKGTHWDQYRKRIDFTLLKGAAA